MKRFLALLVLSANLDAFGATHTCADCSYASVSGTNGLAAVVDGDTIVIPDGTCDWTSKLTISKAIHLRSANGTTNSLTTTITTGTASGTELIEVNLVANKATRISGIYFKYGTVPVNFYPLIIVNGLNTDARSFRIDHCVTELTNQIVFNLNTVNGVMDHCVVHFASTAGLGYVKGSFHDGTQGVNTYGDGSWAAADGLGSTNRFFFESCVFSNRYSQHLTMLDSQAGGRYVFRHNKVYKGSMESHGLEAQRERSGRAFEIYSNSWEGVGTQDFIIYFRGGTGVAYGNETTGYGTTSYLTLLNNRVTESACCNPFGGADGRNQWDVNHAGNPQVTGTCSSAGALTMTDSGKAWTNNFWAGFILRRTSGKTVSSMTRAGATVTVTSTAHGFTTGNLVSIFGADQQPYNNLWSITRVDDNTFTFSIISYTPASPATGTILACLGGYFSEITGNTATQLTFRDSVFAGAYTMTFTAADTYEINAVTHLMDMAGRSLGSLLSGDTPSLPAGWNDQTTSAWYEWGNTNLTGNTDIDFSISKGLVIQSGVHYFNDTVKPGYTAQPYPHYLVSGVQSTPVIPRGPKLKGIKLRHQ